MAGASALFDNLVKQSRLNTFDCQFGKPADILAWISQRIPQRRQRRLSAWL